MCVVLEGFGGPICRIAFRQGRVTKIALARDQRNYENDENLAYESLKIMLLCEKYNELYVYKNQKID